MAAASHARRFTVGLALALVVAVGLSWVLLGGTRREMAQLAKDRRAADAATGAAQAMAGAWGREDGVAEALRTWVASQPQGTGARAIAISGARLVASTFEADVKDGAAPRRLKREEKPLYDRAQRLRATVEGNRQGTAAKRPEREVWTADDGGLGAAAPVASGEDVVGSVEVVLPPGAVATGTNPWPFLLAAIVPFLAFVVVARFAGDRRLVVAAFAIAALAAGAAWAYAAARAELGALAGAAGAHVAGVGRAIGLLAVVALALLLFVGLGAASRVGQTLREHRQAYLYIAPAILGMLVLVFFPFLYGVTLSFTDSNIYTTNKSIAETWIGLRNYSSILGDFNVARRTAEGGLAINYLNFYWTLLFTILWTITNVATGVTSGLILALALNTKGLTARPIYRVLLILPWALPNYITALVWKGMFHQQFGVINQAIELLGGTAIAWFDRPFTSFLTAYTTNAWLSFPFMMVVSLGALQSIPADIYEAARVDGASRWQMFRAITLPSLKPALVPAVILSVVWTFNMFNIIFLVTGGEPSSSTEILVTQAYKYAFERYRYGYAAAYSTIIFGILLVYGIIQNRVSRATEAA